MRWPDPMVDDEAIEASEGADGGGDEIAAIFGGGELLLEGDARLRSAALRGESFGCGAGGAIAECYPGSGLAKEADRGCADSP